MKKKVNEILMVGKVKRLNEKDIVKLHKQFGHPSSKRLASVFKNAGITNKEEYKLLEKVTSDCVVCKQ